MTWLLIILTGAAIFVAAFYFLFDFWVAWHLKNNHRRYSKEGRHVDQ